ncbi:MAG: hypothetical protein EXS17_08145 [Phycisphaerales bacterium]|nr:hypothetical protein [Phycisphaerales bacterium]
MLRPLNRVDSVDISNVFPCVTLLSAIHAGLRPSRLLFAFALLLALVAAGRLWDGLSPSTYGPAGLLAGTARESQLVDSQDSARSLVIPALRSDQRAQAATASLDQLAVLLQESAASTSPDRIDAARYAKLAGTIDAARPRQSFEALDEAVRTSFFAALRAVSRADWAGALDATRQLVIEIPTTSWRSAPWFSAYFALCAVILFIGCAGVLCRVNAGDLSARRWTIRQARAFIRPRLSALCGAPLFALSFAAILWIPIWLIGLFLNVQFFNILGGILFGLALVLSALCAVLLTVLVLGLPLLGPAVACDGCDAVESVQRTGAYIFKRPLHLVAYAILSCFVIAAGGLTADYVAVAAWNVAIGAFDSASGDVALAAQGSMRFLEPFQSGPATLFGMSELVTASLLEMWRTILSLLIGATTLSVSIACATRSYLLIRMQCDGQEVSDLWVDNDIKI